MKKIVAFSGSLRKNSFNTSLLRAAQDLAGDDMVIDIVDISTFPLFNQDDEGTYPPQVQAVKDKVLAADGILFATPEYNRSVPGVLKNAIDWISRPYGTNPFAKKPVYVMSAGGPLSGSLSNYHLKQVMLYLDASIIGQPEFFLNATGKFDENGTLTDENTKEHIKKALGALANR
jgi:chromate reductase